MGYAGARDSHERHRQKLEQRGFLRTQPECIAVALKELDVSTRRKADLELALARTTTAIVNWMFGALLAQGALVVAPH